MKKYSNTFNLKVPILCVLLLIACCSQAQDSTGTAGAIGAETSSYGPTWVWMTGAVVSILLIISLIRWNTNKRTSKN